MCQNLHANRSIRNLLKIQLVNIKQIEITRYFDQLLVLPELLRGFVARLSLCGYVSGLYRHGE